MDFFYPNTLSTMVLDSLETSHPIRLNVNDPKEINLLFDMISYEKVEDVVFFLF